MKYDLWEEPLLHGLPIWIFARTLPPQGSPFSNTKDPAYWNLDFTQHEVVSYIQLLTDGTTDLLLLRYTSVPFPLYILSLNRVRLDSWLLPDKALAGYFRACDKLRKKLQA